jgi:hypothetical protein
MKTSNAVITECVGPRWISMLKMKLNIMSMSGSTERTKIKGTWMFTRKKFPDALLSRYASDMCPIANESCSSLKTKNQFD